MACFLLFYEMGVFKINTIISNRSKTYVASLGQSTFKCKDGAEKGWETERRVVVAWPKMAKDTLEARLDGLIINLLTTGMTWTMSWSRQWVPTRWNYQEDQEKGHHPPYLNFKWSLMGVEVIAVLSTGDVISSTQTFVCVHVCRYSFLHIHTCVNKNQHCQQLHISFRKYERSWRFFMLNCLWKYTSW